MQKQLTTGPVMPTMLQFAVPMILGDLLQQCYNIADTLIVGRFIGTGALAAVGSAFTLMTFLTSILLGLAMGSGTVFSIKYGQKDDAGLKEGILASFVLLAGVTAVLVFAVYAGFDGIIWFLRIPAEIDAMMRTYLRIVFAGLAATFLYNYFASLLRALGNSVVPLVFLAVSAGLNIVLDLWFVCGLGRGVAGAAEATVIAQYVSGVGIALYTWFGFPLLRAACRAKLRPARIKEIASFSALTCIQQSVMNLGHPGRAGSCQQLWHGGHGGVCGGGQNRRLCVPAGAGFRQCVLDFLGAELRCTGERPPQTGYARRVCRGGRVQRGGQRCGVWVCRAADADLYWMRARWMSSPRVCGICTSRARFIVGIGWLFLLYGLYRAVGRPGMSVVLTVISLGIRVALAYTLSAIPAVGVVGIWWSVPIGWFLADAVGLGYYWWKRRTLFEMR